LKGSNLINDLAPENRDNNLQLNVSNIFLSFFCPVNVQFSRLEVIAQLTNAEIAKSDVVTQVRTQDLTVICKFYFSGLPLYLR